MSAFDPKRTFTATVYLTIKVERMQTGEGDRTMNSTGRFTHALRKLTHDSYDHCSQCGASLPKGIPAFAGYTAQYDEIYVGECCKASISELASHIYWWWTTYKRPAPETVLWRYMDFSKFVALLKSGALYFARADNLGDPFEGARGLAEREGEWKAHCLDYFREAILAAPGQTEDISPRELEEEAESLYLDAEASGKHEIQNTYVSCWHANEMESEALWRLYTPPPTIGIAILTDFATLEGALAEDFDIKFGHVQYIDYAKKFAGTYDRIFWKRASLIHEAEVRAVIIKELTSTSDEPGLLVPVDLPRAIKAVVTSPFAPRWFDNVLRDLISKYSFDLPVQPSDLLAEPFI